MRLAEARKHALSLPEAAEAPHFESASFRVRGRIFATVSPDGRHLHVFAPDEWRERVLELHPGWAEKLWWGRKVVGVRVDVTKADAQVVKQLLTSAWRSKAPKKLAAVLAP